MQFRSMVVAVSVLFLTACSSLFTQTQRCEVDPKQGAFDLPNAASKDSIAAADKTKQSENTTKLVSPEKTVATPKPVKKTTASQAAKKPAVTLKPSKITRAQNILGQVEYVDILPQAIRQKARIDTGAATSSIDAHDIITFERDGKKWVKFNVRFRETDRVVEFKEPVVRTVLIKSYGEETVRRIVVKLKLAIGSIEKTLEVNLAERSNFEYPVLIGRNFLDAGIIVDVSHKYLMLDR